MIFIRKSVQFQVFFLILSSLVILPGVMLAAEESITLTTYYPSPYGVYSEMRLYPKASATCDGNQRGLMYYDDDADEFRVCAGTPADWVPVGGSFWTLSGTDLYPNNPAWNVGIGTATPGAKFHISGARDESSGGFGTTGVLQRLSATNNGVEAGWFAGVSGGLNRATFGTVSAHDLGFIVGGATRMTIVGQGANIGNVGIGTTTPGAKLDIAEGSTAQCCASQTPNISLAQASNLNGRMSWLQFHNSGESEAYIRLAGGGVGARAGQRRLEIGDSQGVTAGLTVTGNVGIGTTDPTQKLDINGQVRIRGGSPGPRKVLASSDTNGVAVWKSPGVAVVQNSSAIAGVSAGYVLQVDATCPADTVLVGCSGSRDDSLQKNCPGCDYIGTLPISQDTCRTAVIWNGPGSGAVEAVAHARCLQF